MISSTITSGAEAPAVMPRLLMPSKRDQSRSAGALRQHRDRAALALGDFAQALRVRRVRRADHDQRIDHRRHLLHRELAVGGGVADVFLVRPVDVRETLLEQRDDLGGVVDRQRRLGHEGEVVRILRREGLGVFRGLDQRHRADRQLAERADHFGVVGMPDQEDFAAALEMDRGLAVHLGDQRAGRVQREEIAGAWRRPEPISAPHGPRTPPARWYCRGFRPVPRRKSRPWSSGCRRRSGCGRSRGGHRPGRHRWRAPVPRCRSPAPPRRRSRGENKARFSRSGLADMGLSRDRITPRRRAGNGQFG